MARNYRKEKQTNYLGCPLLLDFFSFVGRIDPECQPSTFDCQQKAGYATQYKLE